MMPFSMALARFAPQQELLEELFARFRRCRYLMPIRQKPFEFRLRERRGEPKVRGISAAWDEYRQDEFRKDKSRQERSRALGRSKREHLARHRFPRKIGEPTHARLHFIP
jgi:hypothetical protein